MGSFMPSGTKKLNKYYFLSFVTDKIGIVTNSLKLYFIILKCRSTVLVKA